MGTTLMGYIGVYRVGVGAGQGYIPVLMGLFCLACWVLSNITSNGHTQHYQMTHAQIQALLHIYIYIYRS